MRTLLILYHIKGLFLDVQEVIFPLLIMNHLLLLIIT
uniref:Uncharacterized protein n=1 Tax=virus sp. ctrcb4 TaxID=2825824 RepID=A0A8S5RQ57_9VIRU|nr:MAG TPA: hypothetical protein [virus sp. ctrcb4]